MGAEAHGQTGPTLSSRTKKGGGETGGENGADNPWPGCAPPIGHGYLDGRIGGRFARRSGPQGFDARRRDTAARATRSCRWSFLGEWTLE